MLDCLCLKQRHWYYQQNRAEHLFSEEDESDHLGSILSFSAASRPAEGRQSLRARRGNCSALSSFLLLLCQITGRSSSTPRDTITCLSSFTSPSARPPPPPLPLLNHFTGKSNYLSDNRVDTDTRLLLTLLLFLTRNGILLRWSTLHVQWLSCGSHGYLPFFLWETWLVSLWLQLSVI